MKSSYQFWFRAISMNSSVVHVAQSSAGAGRNQEWTCPNPGLQAVS
jgi:hypothetical protein